ncbi:arginine--tRNA ligase [Yeguia hominis]|uniref:Arginine--tRNA ligase n=1 Tax=Yeguia hominis TaxID=2763662 RepID=A0A926D8D4_9FIRM|nr:arginine--tRNA ligase [Yeguia hominis]MBC8533293.1 arginine--tRNA ligase [Yeguia hominis]
MSKLVGTATEALRGAVRAAMEAAIADGTLPQADLPEFALEVPADRAHGDWACNAAMVGARAFRTAPRKIAEAIASHLDLSGSYFERVEIAGPGFLNFFLQRKFYGDVLKDVLMCKETYGHSDYGAHKRVMVEFVSANPTGPMHMGNARGGALGDCLAAVLDAAGYDVWREFYVNDAGNQIEKFGLSLDIRYQQIYRGDAVELPEDSYHGEDILDRAKEFAAIYGDKYLAEDEKTRRAALVAYALPKNIEKMKADMAKYRIVYDEWFLESRLHKDGEVADTIAILRDKGLTYEKDGALWYNAMKFGAEKDEVLIRKNGMPTYFAADIAYHRNKFETRGFDKCIDIWGADHHGHVARMKDALHAIGIDPARLDIVLMQLVRLMRDGEVVRMSKRTGKAIQLADLLDEVPVDAARFLFNMREANAQMDFDLDLAVQQDAQNPVYYVQYANARICSILRALEKDGISFRDCTDAELAKLDSSEETELIRHIASYTDEIVAAAKDYDPARITRYVITLATLFHKFYNAKRVKGEEDGLLHARLLLCVATRTVIENVLKMFNISAPETM